MKFNTRTLALAGPRSVVARAFMNTLARGTVGTEIGMPPGFNAKAAQLSRLETAERHSRPAVDGITARNGTMPPGHKAHVAQLDTFKLPDRTTGSIGDRMLGKALLDAWRRDGIIQIAMSESQKKLWWAARDVSLRFFKKPHNEKAACVESQSYAGYIASGEEVTDGIADYSEIFTITKDLDLSDARVRAKWPCHGPCPWPDSEMKEVMTAYSNSLGVEGEKLLRLVEMGLGVPSGSLTRYTRDGWHHTRVLR